MLDSFADVQDFFDGVERLAKTTPPSEVQLHPSYSRSNAKKMLKDLTFKDLRKAIDSTSRRVDKQFIDEDAPPADAETTAALIGTVWREVTNGLKKETSRIEGLLKSCYADASMTLEFGTGDVENACKKAR